MSYLTQNKIAFQELGKLIGRMSFSQTMLFGEFARTQLRPLYQKQYREVYNATLSADDRAILTWWHGAIISSSPRVCRPLSRKFDWLVYTDAASKPPCICDPLFDPHQGRPKLDAQLTAFVRPRTHLFKKTCLILGLELLALAAFLEDYAPFLAGRSVWIYMDNNNCLSAVTRGDSNADAIAILVGRIWGAIQKRHISAWFSRAPSKQNPADLPTRDTASPFPIRSKASFKSFTELFRLVRKNIKKTGRVHRKWD